MFSYLLFFFFGHVTASFQQTTRTYAYDCGASCDRVLCPGCWQRAPFLSAWTLNQKKKSWSNRLVSAPRRPNLLAYRIVRSWSLPLPVNYRGRKWRFYFSKANKCRRFESSQKWWTPSKTAWALRSVEDVIDRWFSCCRSAEGPRDPVFLLVLVLLIAVGSGRAFRAAELARMAVLPVYCWWASFPCHLGSPIDYRSEDGRSPVFASCVTSSNPDLFSSSETGVNPGIRS